MQSPNLDNFFLRNIIVVDRAKEWEWCSSAIFDARGVRNRIHSYVLMIHCHYWKSIVHVTNTIDFQY